MERKSTIDLRCVCSIEFQQGTSGEFTLSTFSEDHVFVADNKVPRRWWWQRLHESHVTTHTFDWCATQTGDGYCVGDGDQARDCRCAATSVRNALRRAGDSDRHWRHRVGAGTPLDQDGIREPQRDIHTDTRLNLSIGHGICNSVELGIRHADRIGIDFGTRAGTTNGGEASHIYA